MFHSLSLAFSVKWSHLGWDHDVEVESNNPHCNSDQAETYCVSQFRIWNPIWEYENMKACQTNPILVRKFYIVIGSFQEWSCKTHIVKSDLWRAKNDYNLDSRISFQVNQTDSEQQPPDNKDKVIVNRTTLPQVQSLPESADPATPLFILNSIINL